MYVVVLLMMMVGAENSGSDSIMNKTVDNVIRETDRYANILAALLEAGYSITFHIS